MKAAKDEARAHGSELDVYAVGVVTCRPTQKEAEEYYHYAMIENGDWSAVDGILGKKNISLATVGEEEFQRQRQHYVHGMGGLLMVGDPDQIAQTLADLSRAGLRGIGFSFVNYLKELPYLLRRGAAAARAHGHPREAQGLGAPARRYHRAMIQDTDTNRRRNLGYFFDATVRRLPDKVAIIDLFGGRERSATYRQLDERMNRVARMLARLGVRPGERVAMLVGNRVEFIEFFFGAMRAGAIPLPLNTRLAADTLEGHHRRRRMRARRSSIRRATARRSRSRWRVPVRHRMLLDEKKDGFLACETEMAKPGARRRAAADRRDAQAFQPYTSGSTGRPKGAIMTHRGMLWYVAYNQRYWPAAESDRGLIALPLFHKNAMRGTVKPMLYAGGSFVLMPGYEPRAYLEALAKYKCTYSRGVAAVFTMFLQHRDLAEHARSLSAQEHDHRLGGGDAGAAGRWSSARCRTSRSRRATG